MNLPLSKRLALVLVCVLLLAVAPAAFAQGNADGPGSGPVVRSYAGDNDLAGALPDAPLAALDSVVLVDNLQPSWTAPGGGGVWGAYYGPPDYLAVSPGATALFDGREAGIIKAGLTPDPDDGNYWDEGLLAFKVNVDISSFASQALSYDVENETGANPVWVRIRLVSGAQYQFVPTTNPASWHTVDAAAGGWQLMDGDGNATGPMMTLAEVAAANPGATVDRVYLTLGIGNSYNVSPGVGTVGWVDKVMIGGVTYDFVVPQYWYVAKTGSDSNEGTLVSPFLTVQKAVDSASSGDTIHVAAGTYAEAVNLNKAVKLLGAGSGTSGTVLTNPSGTDSKVGVVQLAASGTSGSPILLRDLRIQPVGLAGLSVGRFTESTGANVDYLTLDNVQVVGTNTSPCTEQERGLYVDLTSSLRHLTISNSAFDDLHYGWYLQKAVSADTSTVRYVDVTNTTFNHNNIKGIYAEKLSDATFTDVTVSQNGYDASLLSGCSYFVANMAGIDVNLKAGAYSNLAFANLTATNNAPTAANGAGLAVKARGTGSDSSYAAYPASLSGVAITGGTFSGSTSGIRVGEPGKANTSPTGVNVQHASLAGNSAYGLDNRTTVQVVAENNWWGSPCPSVAVNGNVDYDPWWLDPAGATTGTAGSLTILSGYTTAEQQIVLNCAAPGATVTWQASGTTYAGGLTVNTNGLTLNLNGNTFGHGSAWLTANADDVTVLGPGVIDGAGGGGGGGIVVNAGADNFILQNVEIKNWTDGVEIAGSVVSLKIVDNFIHDNTGAGLKVDSGVSIGGVINIYGNLFKVNGGNGVQNDGATNLPAQYNSWGDIDGSPAGSGGDGVSANVDASNPTFLEYFMDMDPDTLATTRRAGAGTSFDVVLKANARKVNGIAFKITYSSAVLLLNSATFQGIWAGSGASCLTPTPVAGEVEGACFLTSSEWDGDAAPIMKLNFTVLSLPSSPYPSALDILHEDTDTNAGANGGAKVYVNNAGYGLASTPDRDITDANDGELILGTLANYTGFVDLQGRANESGATLVTKNVAAKATSVDYASGTSVSSGAYTTAHLTPLMMFQGETYWFQFDRALYLPTTQMGTSPSDTTIPTTWQHTKMLVTAPTTPLAKVVLLGGDGTDNNVIDILDAGCMGNSYRRASTCTGGPGANSDVNGDGVTDILDLSLMGGNYYKVESPWTP